MSRAYSYYYSPEEKKRREIRDERTRRTVEGYYLQYKAMYEDMEKKGFSFCLPKEKERLREDLRLVESYIQREPSIAR